MLEIDAKKVEKNIISFIRNVINGSTSTKVVIGVSGGIDSAVALACLCRAIGEENIIAVCLPYGKLNTQGLLDAKKIIKAYNIPKHQQYTIDIQPVVDLLALYDRTMNSERKGNIMARIRMIFLYDAAKKSRGLVCGTENKSEHLLGYFTRHGDSASDFEPIRHLYKTQIISLARHLLVPEEICNKAPSAGLYAGQSDEGEFGFSYTDADKVLHLFYDKNYTKNQIYESGLSADLVNRVLQRTATNAFKHIVPHVIS